MIYEGDMRTVKLVSDVLGSLSAVKIILDLSHQTFSSAASNKGCNSFSVFYSEVPGKEAYLLIMFIWWFSHSNV